MAFLPSADAGALGRASCGAFAVPECPMNGESLAARAANGARNNNRAVAAAGRNGSLIALAVHPRPAPPPSAIAGQTRKNHRCKAATSAPPIEGGALDGVPTARGVALLAPASGSFGEVETRLPSLRAEAATCCVVSLRALVTEPTEFLAALAIRSTEGTSTPELEDGEGVGAASVCTLTGAGVATGGGGAAGGIALGSDGAAFGVASTDSTVDPTVSAASPRSVADAAGTLRIEPIRIAPETKKIRRHRRCSAAVPVPFVHPRLIRSGPSLLDDAEPLAFTQY